MPDIYADDKWEPEIRLKSHDPKDDDEPSGFDPYDTAVLHQEK